MTFTGAHLLCNLRPSCKLCNLRKKARWPVEHVAPSKVITFVA
jgi:hypothetical protein